MYSYSFSAAKDENVRKIMREIEYLTEDCTKLQQILDIAMSLRLEFHQFAQSDSCRNYKFAFFF